MRPLPLLALIATLLLGGCASWPPGESFEQRLQQAQAAQDYRRALELIESVPEDDPRHKALAEDARQLRQKASDWRAQQLDQVHRLAARGAWREGMRILQETRDKLPADLGVEKELAAYRQDQERALQTALLEFALIRARHLAQEEPVLTQARNATLEPHRLGPIGQRQIEDRRQVLEILLPAAQDAHAEERWARVRELLEAALALNPETPEPLHEQLQAAREHLASREAQARAQRDRKRHQRLQQALAEARAAREAGDYQTATQALERARKANPDHPEVAGEEVALEQAIENFVTARLAEGDRLYAQGRIERALQLWREADTLRPSAELSERIEKAERFLQRYRSLKEEDK